MTTETETQILATRFLPADIRRMRHASKRSGLALATWLRMVALDALRHSEATHRETPKRKAAK